MQNNELEQAFPFRQDVLVNPEALNTLSHHTNAVHAFSVLPNGWLASGSADKLVKILAAQQSPYEALTEIIILSRKKREVNHV